MELIETSESNILTDKFDAIDLIKIWKIAVKYSRLYQQARRILSHFVPCIDVTNIFIWDTN